MFTVQEIQTYIEKQTGLQLEICQDFPGLKVYKGKSYYNFLTKERFSESQEVLQLQRLAKRSNVIHSIEPNGLNRVAILMRNF